MIKVRHRETGEIHEAYQVTKKELDAIAEWCGGKANVDPITNKPVVVVPTKIYPIRAYPDDYIIKIEKSRGVEFFLKDAGMFDIFFTIAE